MVFLVPYDGSPVSERALDRAVQHGRAMETAVVAVSLIPTGAQYAERRKWIEPTDEFATEAARAELERKIEEATDDAERNFEDARGGALGNGAAEHVRRVAGEVDASVLFVGTRTDAADDRLLTPFGEVEPEGEYDIHLVRPA